MSLRDKLALSSAHHIQRFILLIFWMKISCSLLVCSRGLMLRLSSCRLLSRVISTGSFCSWLSSSLSFCSCWSAPISAGRLVRRLPPRSSCCSCCNWPISLGRVVRPLSYRSICFKARNWPISAGRRVILGCLLFSWPRLRWVSCWSALDSRGNCCGVSLNSSAQARSPASHAGFSAGGMVVCCAGGGTCAAICGCGVVICGAGGRVVVSGVGRVK